MLLLSWDNACWGLGKYKAWTDFQLREPQTRTKAAVLILDQRKIAAHLQKSLNRWEKEWLIFIPEPPVLLVCFANDFQKQAENPPICLCTYA